MGVQVTFDYAQWVAVYTAFAAAPSQAQVEALVPIAEVYNRNDGVNALGSTAALQSTLLNMMVAHVVQLMYGPNGTSPGGSGVVGRVNSASEGSVSVGVDWPGANPEAAWFLQTEYGAMWWQATAQYRTAIYIPGSRRVMNPWLYPFGGVYRG